MTSVKTLATVAATAVVEARKLFLMIISIRGCGAEPSARLGISINQEDEALVVDLFTSSPS
jgi:hypothetical protein